MMLRKMTILTFSLIILISCSKKNKDCQLIGKWKSFELTSNKAVDINNDGLYNQDLLKEDKCSEVIFDFKENGTVDRRYRNMRSGCKFKKSTLQYVIDEDEIVFTVSGMKQTQKFDITDCKLRFYGVKDFGITENGEQHILIQSTFEKQ